MGPPRGQEQGGGGPHNLATITRGPEALRPMRHHGNNPVQRRPANQAAISRVEFLSQIAKWAAVNNLASLGAFYGERLASTCQSAGIPSPVLNLQCERCELVFLPRQTCTVRSGPRKRRKRQSKAGEGKATVNMVVYECHYCKYRNTRPENPRQHVKTKLAEAAAREQMKELSNNSSSSSQPIATDLTPVHAQGVMKFSFDDSSISVTPSDSRHIISPADSAVQVDSNASSGKKRKRQGWTGLKAISTL